jgi:hypothetical protein
MEGLYEEAARCARSSSTCQASADRLKAMLELHPVLIRHVCGVAVQPDLPCKSREVVVGAVLSVYRPPRDVHACEPLCRIASLVVESLGWRERLCLLHVSVSASKCPPHGPPEKLAKEERNWQTDALEDAISLALRDAPESGLRISSRLRRTCELILEAQCFPESHIKKLSRLLDTCQSEHDVVDAIPSGGPANTSSNWAFSLVSAAVGGASPANLVSLLKEAMQSKSLPWSIVVVRVLSAEQVTVEGPRLTSLHLAVSAFIHEMLAMGEPSELMDVKRAVDRAGMDAGHTFMKIASVHRGPSPMLSSSVVASRSLSVALSLLSPPFTSYFEKALSHYGIDPALDLLAVCASSESPSSRREAEAWLLDALSSDGVSLERSILARLPYESKPALDMVRWAAETCQRSELVEAVNKALRCSILPIPPPVEALYSSGACGFDAVVEALLKLPLATSISVISDKLQSGGSGDDFAGVAASLFRHCSFRGNICASRLLGELIYQGVEGATQFRALLTPPPPYLGAHLAESGERWEPLTAFRLEMCLGRLVPVDPMCTTYSKGGAASHVPDVFALSSSIAAAVVTRLLPGGELLNCSSSEKLNVELNLDESPGRARYLGQASEEVESEDVEKFRRIVKLAAAIGAVVRPRCDWLPWEPVASALSDAIASNSRFPAFSLCALLGTGWGSDCSAMSAALDQVGKDYLYASTAAAAAELGTPLWVECLELWLETSAAPEKRQEVSGDVAAAAGAWLMLQPRHGNGRRAWFELVKRFSSRAGTEDFPLVDSSLLCPVPHVQGATLVCVPPFADVIRCISSVPGWQGWHQRQLLVKEVVPIYLDSEFEGAAHHMLETWCQVVAQTCSGSGDACLSHGFRSWGTEATRLDPLWLPKAVHSACSKRHATVFGLFRLALALERLDEEGSIFVGGAPSEVIACTTAALDALASSDLDSESYSAAALFMLTCIFRLPKLGSPSFCYFLKRCLRRCARGDIHTILHRRASVAGWGEAVKALNSLEYDMKQNVSRERRAGEREQRASPVYSVPHEKSGGRADVKRAISGEELAREMSKRQRPSKPPISLSVSMRRFC